MKPFIVALGAVVLTVPVFVSAVFTFVALCLAVWAWHTREYWIPRAFYYSTAWAAFALGVWAVGDASFNPSRHPISDFLSFITAEVVLVSFLLQLHRRRGMIDAMEFSVFHRRHERHMRESLRVFSSDR